MSNHSLKKSGSSWVQVASAFGTIEADVLGSMLRSYDVPVYIEPASGSLSASAFGGGMTQFLIFVPEEYVNGALILLEGDEDPPALDEPSIKL